MDFDLGNLLQKYVDACQNNAPEQVQTDFNDAVQHAPIATVANGVSEALRSDQTPPFGSVVGQLFGNGSGQQRSGMVNVLLQNLAPTLISTMAGGVLGKMFSGNSNTSDLTPEQVQQLTPDQVNEIAATAEHHNPSVVDRMGNFYAQHPSLIKGIGAAGLAIALGHIAQNRNAS